jgi:hypothetical protein
MSVRFYDSFVKRLTRDQVPGPTEEGVPSNVERYMVNMENPNPRPDLKNTMSKPSDYGKTTEE